MPMLGHVVYGLCLLIPIMYYTKDKFNYKVAFIFLANNIYGPDVVYLFFITPFHSILGYAILAIPLSLVYSYSSRFSLKKSEGKFPLKFIDEEIREVDWKNAYYLSVAGGISHFFVDQFYHFEKEMWIWPGIAIHHDEMLAWGGPLYHVVDPLYLIGEQVCVIAIILSIYYFSKGSKATFKALITLIAISVFLMLAISTAVFMGEREFGVIVHSIVYVLIPLFLLMYAAREVRDNKRETPDVPKIKRSSLINIVAMISIIVALFLLAYVYIAISEREYLASYIAEDMPYYHQNPSDIAASIVIIGYIYGTVALILLIGSIGLFFKINFCRYLVIAASLYFFIFGFPLAIALFLCEKDIKEMFGKGTEV
ncbi:MAG: hypothetical protein ACFFDK_04780 [Promethearchaeota archaeon]